jgi:monoamine oxidase
MQHQKHIIIIGAGAAGLMAAKELSVHGYAVTILEAKDNPGGRICTDIHNKFGMPVEPGAEFIHGKLKLTTQLLKEGNISYSAVNGNILRVIDGKINKPNNSDEQWDELMQRMNELKEDVTIHDFLQTYFSDDKYAQLRRSVQDFAEGFDLADITKAAVTPLKKEWEHEEEIQYRVDGGYIKLITYLVNTCTINNVTIHYNCCAETIEWHKDAVTITTKEDKKFVAAKLIVTVSLGVFQAGNLKFTPSIPEYVQAANTIGFGAVIKILLQFNQSFWKEKSKGAGFILSNEAIPTWWLQLPVQNNLLTGWLGGPKAFAHKHSTNEEIILLALLQQQLLHHAVYSWCNDKYTLGGYSYNTLSSEHAKTVLNTPVENTIFFAGEALYRGDEQATVEAALQSGLTVASLIAYTQPIDGYFYK